MNDEEMLWILTNWVGPTLDCYKTQNKLFPKKALTRLARLLHCSEEVQSKALTTKTLLNIHGDSRLALKPTNTAKALPKKRENVKRWVKRNSQHFFYVPCMRHKYLIIFLYSTSLRNQTSASLNEKAYADTVSALINCVSPHRVSNYFFLRGVRKAHEKWFKWRFLFFSALASSLLPISKERTAAEWNEVLSNRFFRCCDFLRCLGPASSSFPLLKLH